MKDVSESHEGRLKFVRRRGLCDNCLLQGHVVKSCPKPSFCKVTGCQSKHSTYLHPRNDTRVAEKSSGPDVPWKSVGESDNGTTVDNNGARNSCVNAAKAEFAAIGVGDPVLVYLWFLLKLSVLGRQRLLKCTHF